MDPQNIILDLDLSRSINDLGINIDTKHMSSTIYVLIDIIKYYGKNIGLIHKDIGTVTQYCLPVKYLGHTLPIIFEFDYSHQYINFIYYNNDQTKIYLKIFISINDDTTIKYIENDRSGMVPSYANENFSLKPGEYLVNFSHCFMSYINVNRIRLDDDSCLITKDPLGMEIKTKLWLHSLLIRGRSWYAKFGYEPANINACEHKMALTDIQNLKLNEISECLNKILSASNKENLDKNLIDNSISLFNLIGTSNETLLEYTKNHTLKEFTELTNRLTQSVYSRTVLIQITSTLDDDDIYITIEFPWFEKYKKLLLVNVMQINNNIHKHFHKLN